MLDLSSLEKSINSLRNALEVVGDEGFNESLEPRQQEVLRAGVIQNFEFTYELCWKFIQRWLSINHSEEAAQPRTRKDLFRHAAQKSLVESPDPWFGYTEARNMTAHTYEADKATQVFEVARPFLKDAEYLLAQLKQKND